MKTKIMAAFVLVALALVAMVLASCGSDNKDERIARLESQVANLESQLGQLRATANNAASKGDLVALSSDLRPKIDSLEKGLDPTTSDLWNRVRELNDIQVLDKKEIKSTLDRLIKGVPDFLLDGYLNSLGEGVNEAQQNQYNREVVDRGILGAAQIELTQGHTDVARALTILGTGYILGFDSIYCESDGGGKIPSSLIPEELRQFLTKGSPYVITGTADQNTSYPKLTFQVDKNAQTC